MPPMRDSRTRTSDVTIRRLEPATELDRLAPLWQALQAHHLSLDTIDEPGRDPAESWAVRRGIYERGLAAGGTVWIAERGGDAVAYAYVKRGGHWASWEAGPVASLETLVVLPTERGAGLGDRLVTTVAEAMRAEGITHLQVGYIEGNDRAAAFYARAGFRPIEPLLAMPLR
jgi:GNAT superfamily N-acetyltransferase